MAEKQFSGDQEFQPPEAKRRKSLSLKRRKDLTYCSPTKSLEEYQAPFCPKNTQVNTRWAVKSFDDWAVAYNPRHPENPCPDNVLLCDSSSVLAAWLQKYVLSIRKKNGEKYPPKTIYLLLCGLQRYMREHKPRAFDIFDRDDQEFKVLLNTCDNYFRELRSEGLGSQSKPTEALSKEDEQKLWTTGVLSTETPKGLLNAVFFYNGKNFVLRGGSEHQDLKFSQLKRSVDGNGCVCYTYTEHSSKNRCGGFNQLNIANKTVTQYQDVRAGERCHTFLLDLYFKKVPTAALKGDMFYLRPLSSVPSVPDAPWFYSTPVGRNTLSKMLATMCEEAGIVGRKTNHSLRATAATELFHGGIAEKVIQDRTGHRSVEGLHRYERVSD